MVSLLGKITKSWLAFAIMQLIYILAFTWILIAISPVINNWPLLYPRFDTRYVEDKAFESSTKSLRSQVQVLQKKANKLTPGGVYLIINTTDNHFELYKNQQLLRSGKCSTGSYIRLETDQKKNWLFKTPKGVFTIKGKTTNPVWRKPDWAFVEEGLPIPKAGDPSRFEYGVLGDYALSLGDGYLIHGTLYQRFLGSAVTHGCIRMGDDDLEIVYNNLPTGAKVFIY